jgi:hypothetical protein
MMESFQAFLLIRECRSGTEETRQNAQAFFLEFLRQLSSVMGIRFSPGLRNLFDLWALIVFTAGAVYQHFIPAMHRGSRSRF